MPTAEPTVSRAVVRRLQLERQGLLNGARCKVDAESVLATLERLGQAQLDPMSVVQRGEHLTLWSRLPGYRPELLDELRRPEPRVFEHFTRAASLLPLALYPLVAPAMARRRGDNWWATKWVRQWLDEFPGARRRLLRELEKRGPLRSRDFAGETASKGWGGGKLARQGLEALAATGELIVRERRGGEKVYDLTARALPRYSPSAKIDEGERVWRLLRTALHAFGACEAGELAGAFGAVAWPPDRKLAAVDLTRLAPRNETAYFRLEGARGRWLCLADDLERLTGGKPRRRARRMTLLGPFDNLLWNRRRVATLFDFDYRLEAYTPPAKRTYGYYVLPILWGDALVGRLDAKLERERSTLAVNGVWLEQGTRASQELAAELARTLKRFARFLGARHVEIRAAVPAALKGKLAKQL